MLQPNPFCPSITPLPQAGHFPNTSIFFFSLVTSLMITCCSFLIFSTASVVNSKIVFRKSCFVNFCFSILDNVFSKRPVNSKSNTSFIEKVSTNLIASSVQSKFFFEL